MVYFPEGHWVIISTTPISAKSTCVKKNEKGFYLIFSYYMYFCTFLLIFICFVYFPEGHWVIISTTQHQISAKSTCVKKNEKCIY